LFIIKKNILQLCSLILILLWVECGAQSNGIRTTGDVILVTLPATALTTSLLLKDNQGLGQFAKGFGLNQILTFGFKGLVGKRRPDGIGLDSFPSGHTSTTFQSASFIQRRYGWKYGIPSYLLAGFTAYSRINANRHDLADVLAGAALGIGCTYLFTTPYENQDYQISISGSTKGFMFSLRYSF
jgi:membrane-associated phospholipid phosphatase